MSPLSIIKITEEEEEEIKFGNAACKIISAPVYRRIFIAIVLGSLLSVGISYANDSNSNNSRLMSSSSTDALVARRVSLGYDKATFDTVRLAAAAVKTTREYDADDRREKKKSTSTTISTATAAQTTTTFSIVEAMEKRKKMSEKDYTIDDVREAKKEDEEENAFKGERGREKLFSTAAIEASESKDNNDLREKKNSNKKGEEVRSSAAAQQRAKLSKMPNLIDLFEQKAATATTTINNNNNYIKNNVKCQSVFTIGLEGVGHHAFQMGKDAFMKTLLRDHLKKSNEHENGQETDKLFIDNDIHFDNLLLESKYDEIFNTFRKGCENVAEMHKKNNNEKLTSCYSTRSYSFPHKLGPFATGKGLDVNHAKRWDPNDKTQRDYLFQHGHPIDIVKYYNAAKNNQCDVKFVLLHRNIVETARSHKNWDTGLNAHVNVLKMFAEYIDQSLSKIPDNAWVRVNYEDFWKSDLERDEIFTKLVDFLGWQSNASEAFANSQFDLNVHPKKYKTKSKPPCEEIKELDIIQREFFDTMFKAYARRDKHVTNEPLSHFFTESPNKREYESCYEQHREQLGLL